MLCQSSSFHFGKVTQNDLMLKRYPKDTTTEAAVLYEAGRSYFEDNANYQFDLYFECKTRIKVFSKAGLKWAQMSIPFTIEDNISDISGYTYNLEGGNIQTTPLDPATAFTEKIDRYWSNLKIAMPNVKEGSVFEISYKIKSSYLFNLRGWEFQREIPVQYSEYTTQIVPFYQYAKVLQGTKNFSNFIIYEDPEEKKINDIAYHDIISKFIMKDVPAFKN